MDDFVSAVLRGMTFGSIYALLAVGLVLTYKAAGVFNLAFGAQAFVSGAVYYELRTRHDWPIPLAVVVAVLIAAPLLGLLLDRLLFRHLRTAPPLTRLVTTLGLLVALPEIVGLFFKESTTSVPLGIAPDGPKAYHPYGSVFLNRDDIATITVTVVVVIGLIAMFRYTALGLRMRAVVEGTRLTELAGVNADLVSMGAWIMSSVLAGLAGVLIAPNLSQINDIYYTPLVVAAISAAVLASLSSIWVAFLGGLGLGVLSQVLSIELPTNSILATNLRPSLPFVALFLVLIFSPKLRNRREIVDPLAAVDPPPPTLASAERSEALTLATRVFGLVVGTAFFYWLFFHANISSITRTQTAVVLSVIFLSITVITGMAGQISLCQATFAGIGGFATAQLGTDLGVSVIVAIVLAGFVAAAVGALVAIPALRLGGIYLSLATFAFALFFDNVMAKFTWVRGGDGIIPHDTPRPLIGSIDFENEKSFLVLCLVVLVLVALLVIWVRGGSTGRYLDALRGSETAAASIGINPTRARIIAFALSAGIAGLGGGLFAVQERAANYQSHFVAQLGLVWVVIVVTLGARTVEGAIQAGIGLTFFQTIVLATWIPWLVNHAIFVPIVLVIVLVNARLLARRERIPILVANAAFAIFGIWYLLADPSWQIRSVPSGLGIVFFGLGAITYARHPEGVLEHNKRASLARIQRLIDRRARRARTVDVVEPEPPAPPGPQPVEPTAVGRER